MAVESSEALVNSAGLQHTRAKVSISHPIEVCAWLGVANTQQIVRLGGVVTQCRVHRFVVGIANAKDIPELLANHGTPAIALSSAGIEGLASPPRVVHTSIGIAELAGRWNRERAHRIADQIVLGVIAHHCSSLRASSTRHRTCGPCPGHPMRCHAGRIGAVLESRILGRSAERIGDHNIPCNLRPQPTPLCAFARVTFNVSKHTYTCVHYMSR